MALQAALLLGWAQLSDDMKQSIHWILPVISGFVIFVGIVGRLTKQKGLDDHGQPN